MDTSTFISVGLSLGPMLIGLAVIWGKLQTKIKAHDETIRDLRNNSREHYTTDARQDVSIARLETLVGQMNSGD